MLAIENEAPTFIKTTEQSYGRVSDYDVATGNQTYTGSKMAFRSDSGTGVSTGFPLENQNWMYCESRKFESMAWDKNLIEAG